MSLFISRPHAVGVNESDVSVTGLKPNPDTFESFVNIHPLMGFPMSGRVRLQLNVLARKSFGFSPSFNVFNEDLMLPIAWFDTVRV